MSLPLPVVLAAEDEETDAIILGWAFKKAGLPQRLVVVRDGREAVDYLEGSPPYADRAACPLPALLLLDLKMPFMTGFDVLAWMSERPDLRRIPTVVFSSSAAERDMETARRMGARGYFVKPNGMEEYVRILRSVHAQWLTGSAPALNL